MAPEVMLNRNHELSADYFAVGVIAYECMTGKRPYRGKNKNAIRDKILEKQEEVHITPGCPYEDYPQEAADFINLCIKKNPAERLCGLAQVKAHPWFQGFEWDQLLSRQIDPLYKPAPGQNNYDEKNVHEEEKDGAALEEFVAELKHQSAHDQFKGYFYDKDHPKATQ